MTDERIKAMQKEAMGRNAFNTKSILDLYETSDFGKVAKTIVRQLCLSHERLRSELEAAQKLIDERDAAIVDLKATIADMTPQF